MFDIQHRPRVANTTTPQNAVFFTKWTWQNSNPRGLTIYTSYTFTRKYILLHTHLAANSLHISSSSYLLRAWNYLEYIRFFWNKTITTMLTALTDVTVFDKSHENMCLITFTSQSGLSCISLKLLLFRSLSSSWQFHRYEIEHNIGPTVLKG